MAIYLVHEPATAGAGQSAAERAVFVRDRFSFWALAFGPFWLLARGLWLVLAGYIVFVAALIWALAGFAPAGLAALGFVFPVLHLLLAMEASNLRSWTLARRGYALRAIVTGHNLDDSERRYFAARPGPRPEPLRPASTPSAPGNGVIGVFPKPGGNQ